MKGESRGLNGLLRRRHSRRDTPAPVDNAGLEADVSRISASNPAHTRAASYAVAGALQSSDIAALPVLSLLLERSSRVWEVDEGSLVNALSALQFASMLPQRTAAAWRPPSPELEHALRIGLRRGGDLAEQVTDLLWALVDRQLLNAWVTNEVARQIAHDGSEVLDRGLLLHLAALQPPARVLAGEEFPSDLVRA